MRDKFITLVWAITGLIALGDSVFQQPRLISPTDLLVVA
jgi:hypothetical protein